MGFQRRIVEDFVGGCEHKGNCTYAQYKRKEDVLDYCASTSHPHKSQSYRYFQRYTRF